MPGLLRDLRYSIRALSRSPAFTFVAIATLALGIGGTAAVFTVVNGVILRPLPYPEPDRVVYLTRTFANGNSSPVMSAWKYDYVRRNATAFEAVETHAAWATELGGGDVADEVRGLRASAGFFRVHGVEPELGRSFLETEDQRGASPVVVLSDRLWRTRFDADPDVVGEIVRLGGEPHAVVGVMPETYRFPELPGNTDFIVPFALEPDIRDLSHNFLVRMRLAPDITLDRALAELRALSNEFRVDHPTVFEEGETGFAVMTYAELEGSQMRTMLWLLFGAVGFVLLIACANVANLLLVRGLARGREIAIRSAMGASWRRIARQLSVESLVVALAAGVAGVLLARWFVDLLVALAPFGLPRAEQIALDARVLAFAVGISVLTGASLGLVGLYYARLAGPGALLSASQAQQAGSRRGQRLRGMIAGGEVGLAVVLVTGSALLIASLLELGQVDLGFEPDGVTIIEFPRTPDGFGTAETAAYLDGALERIRGLPGVTSAGATSQLPMLGQYNFPMTVVGRPDATRGDVQWRAVTSGYFETLRAQLIRGRFFGRADEAASSSPVVVVNERFVRAHFDGADPIGQQIAIGTYAGEDIIPNFDDPPREIIGVVGDMRDLNLRLAADEAMYVPRAQMPSLDGFGDGRNEGVGALGGIVLRGEGRALPAAELQAIVRAVDLRVPVPRIGNMSEILSLARGSERYYGTLLSAFATVALALAAVGIYGVIAATVQQRVREIGVRMALGADEGAVVRMVMRQGLVPVLAGVAFGILCATGLSGLLRAYLFGISPRDPSSFLVAAGILVVIGLIATYLPAKRAARIDPSANLRSD